jgi:hypothetical protein
MKIEKPTHTVFYIATFLAIVALLSNYGVSLPIVGGYEFLVLAIAFVLLWLGVVLKGF